MGEFQGSVTKGGLPTSSPGTASLAQPPCAALSGAGKRKKGRGGGGTHSHPGHPASPETGRPKVTRQPSLEP